MRGLGESEVLSTSTVDVNHVVAGIAAQAQREAKVVRLVPISTI
jgi:hypothetical protein